MDPDGRVNPYTSAPAKITRFAPANPARHMGRSRQRINPTDQGLPMRLAAARIQHEPIETYSNGVRHVKVPDPDGNAIAFAEPPDAASS